MNHAVCSQNDDMTCPTCPNSPIQLLFKCQFPLCASDVDILRVKYSWHHQLAHLQPLWSADALANKQICCSFPAVLPAAVLKTALVIVDLDSHTENPAPGTEQSISRCLASRRTGFADEGWRSTALRTFRRHRPGRHICSMIKNGTSASARQHLITVSMAESLERIKLACQNSQAGNAKGGDGLAQQPRLYALHDAHNPAQEKRRMVERMARFLPRWWSTTRQQVDQAAVGGIIHRNKLQQLPSMLFSGPRLTSGRASTWGNPAARRRWRGCAAPRRPAPRTPAATRRCRGRRPHAAVKRRSRPTPGPSPCGPCLLVAAKCLKIYLPTNILLRSEMDRMQRA